MGSGVKFHYGFDAPPEVVSEAQHRRTVLDCVNGYTGGMEWGLVDLMVFIV